MREQVLRRDDAEQLVPLYGVAGIHRLAVYPNAAYLFERGVHRHVRVQLHELDGHYAADSVVWVLQQAVYRAARLGADVFQQLCDEVRGHISQEIRRVVRKQLLEEIRYLGA